MSVLTSFDPFFRDFDRLTHELLGGRGDGEHRWIPVDIYRDAEGFEVRFDLPGVDSDTLDVSVDKNVLSVSARRNWTPDQDDQVVLAERPQGHFSRQLFLGDNLETDHINARYEAGVLTVTIPLAESAKPRKIQIGSGGQQAITTGSHQG